jgi:hypothetical protein
LEEVVITLCSPLNAEQKLNTESLLKYFCEAADHGHQNLTDEELHEAAADFFEEICKFKYMNYGVNAN